MAVTPGREVLDGGVPMRMGDPLAVGKSRNADPNVGCARPGVGGIEFSVAFRSDPEKGICRGPEPGDWSADCPGLPIAGPSKKLGGSLGPAAVWTRS